MLIDMISGPSFGRPFMFWRSAREFKGLNVFGYENAEAERLFRCLRTSTNEAAVRSATQPASARVARGPAGAVPGLERARARGETPFQMSAEPGPRSPVHDLALDREPR